MILVTYGNKTSLADFLVAHYKIERDIAEDVAGEYREKFGADVAVVSKDQTREDWLADREEEYQRACWLARRVNLRGPRQIVAHTASNESEAAELKEEAEAS